MHTAWKVYKYGVFAGPTTGKYGLKRTAYLDTFGAFGAWKCPKIPKMGIT